MTYVAGCEFMTPRSAHRHCTGLNDSIDHVEVILYTCGISVSNEQNASFRLWNYSSSFFVLTGLLMGPPLMTPSTKASKAAKVRSPSWSLKRFLFGRNARKKSEASLFSSPNASNTDGLSS